MPATVCYFFIFSLVCLLKLTHSQDCPARYMRFTPEHTFCIRRNSKCDIKRSGICQLETEEILRLHNEYRNRVALGKEHRAIGGSLPKAGGMLQMVWDDELAVVAQKWAENCNFNHDCNDCRAVEHFAVGQNLVLQTAMCQGYGCREDTQTEPNWQKMIKGLYEEVTYYHKDWMWSFEDLPGPLTGHFTQMIWSRSWRIGCGYTSFKEGSTYKNFYVCNYGPAGNTGKQPVYEKGEPCSACPINSCCGSSCRGGISYPGLCKMLDPNIPPEYRRPSNLFFCGVSLSDIDCQAIVTGHNNWKNIKSVGGNYDSIVLDGGESTILSFNKPIVPNKNSFCLVIKFRKGLLDDSKGDKSSFKANFKMEDSFASALSLQSHSTNFNDYRIHLQWGSRTELALTFSVPRGASKHILDIREISAYDGSCDYVNES